MKSKERILKALQHQETDITPVDFGSTTVTGIHCKIVEGLREYYGLEKHPVRIIDPFQMLGEIEPDLQEIIGTDCLPVFGQKNVFGINENSLHEQTTPWGQKVMISSGIDLTPSEDGNIYIYAQGDKTYPPSAVMPESCYFIDALQRQEYVDDESITPEDNLEEYQPISDEDLQYFNNITEKLSKTDKAIVASFGGAALGDVAFIPGMGLKEPKGIRNISEWYMSTMMRKDYIHAFFAKQTEIAIENYKKIWETVGNKVDVVFTCGTDFGTQDSQFCSLDTFRELWLPYYKKLNTWIHDNTSWKIFKHSCGAILPILPGIIEAGFDIINPVQINAKGMDINVLKREFGKDITFWGGGIDTQKILPTGTPEEIKGHILKQCEILGKNGGFVFNAVHNIQANVPLDNVITLFETLRELRK